MSMETVVNVFVTSRVTAIIFPAGAALVETVQLVQNATGQF